MRTQVLSPSHVARVLNRLAYEVIERNQGVENLEIVGMRDRGVALAEALADRIGAIGQRELQVHKLDVAPFRDDRAKDEHHGPDQSELYADITNKDLVLIDDVIFTGRTARAALDAIVHFGRPRSIQLLVLIDRGHREYPIQPDYAGRLIPTKHQERIVVDIEDGFNVYLEE